MSDNILWGYGGRTYKNLNEAMDTVLRDYSRKNFEATQEALKEVGFEAKRALEGATPPSNNTGEFARSWAVEDKYPNAVYIYNKRLGSPTRIPIANLYEYGQHHTPFIYQTFQAIQPQLFQKFRTLMEQKLK